MLITAAIAETPDTPFAIGQLQLDLPRHDEVLVRIAGTGICHTDLIARSQVLPTPLPAVFGHEGAGVVEAVGDGVTTLSPGDHVVLAFDSCGDCRYCATGLPARCAKFAQHNFFGSRIDGSTPLHRTAGEVCGRFFGQSSFATHAIATVRNAVPVRKDVPLHLLGPLGCGVLTGAGSVLNSLRCRPGSSIAVFGAGSVGCSAILAATMVGCNPIIAVSRNPNRLRLAVELGATNIVQCDADAAGSIRSVTGDGAVYSVETTAVPAVLRQAVECLAPGGTCAHLGTAALGTEVALDMFHLLFDRQIRGIVEGGCVPGVFIPTLIDLYCAGRFPFDRLVTTYPLSKINEAIEESTQRATPKVVLVPA